MAALVGVEAALEGGDLTQALTQALAAWRGCRHERIAQLIERLSAKLASTRPRPGGKTADAKQAAWLALVAQDDPADLDALLVTLPEARKAKPLEQRLGALRGRIDPRIAKAMVALLAHPPVLGATAIDSVLLALELVIQIADPRSAAAFEALIEHVGEDEAEGGGAVRELRQRLPGAWVRLREALAVVEANLTIEAAARLDAIERHLDAQESARMARRPDELFAAVYAHPRDDQARSVLADLLQERGDPRGELIALQLARAVGKRSKREAELLSRHAREWLGPIEPVVLKTGLVYERGFLAKCAVRADGIQHAERLVGRPEWRTVTDLDVGSWHAVAPLIDGMPILLALSGLKFSESMSSHPTLSRLGISILDRVERVLEVRLPALRKLEIESCHRSLEEMAPFWGSELCGQLKHFVVSAYPIDRWIPAMAKLGIDRVGYSYRSSYPWRLWFEGDDVSAQYLWGKSPSRDANQALARMLSYVPDPGRRRVVVDTGVPVDDELAAILGRFAGHDLAE